MPVHLLVSTDANWQEKRVALNGDDFIFVHWPITEPKLRQVVASLPRLPSGHEIEVSLATLVWIDKLGEKLQRGVVLAIDYGFSRDDFFDSQLRTGTLQVRARHRRLSSPFDNIASADISTHVNWTNLAKQAGQSGFKIVGFTDQHHFLAGIMSQAPALFEKIDGKTKRALQTLLHPEMLGRTFQVLALTKDVDLATPLVGLKFARNARDALGL